MQRDCFFTSIALNYLPRALALASSVFEIYPATRFFISIADFRRLSDGQRSALDALVDDFARRGRRLEFLDPLSLYVRPDLLTFRLDIIELCTCVKPGVALHLLESAETVTYLDPDVILFAPLPDAEDQAPAWDVEVTPHALAPSDTRSVLSERVFMNYGIYNLGYLAVRRSPQALAFLQWWKAFCHDFGINAPQAGLFVDQKPVDLLPCFVDRVRILRHPGCNVAWWNLFVDGRRVTSPRGVQFRGVDHPLVFFHFSNLHRPLDGRRRKVAKLLPEMDAERVGHTSSVLLSDHPFLHQLFEEYDCRVRAFDGARDAVGVVPTTGRRRVVSPSVRVLMGEALRRGMRFERDPFDSSHWRVATSCALFVLRRMRWTDAKHFIGAHLRFARTSLATDLLQFDR